MNNVAVAAYYEEARTAFLRSALGPWGADHPAGAGWFVVADLHISYLDEVSYPGVYTVGVATQNIGRSSLQLVCGLFEGTRCLGLSEVVLVYVTDGGPTPLPVGVRSAVHARTLRAPGTSRLDLTVAST